MDSAQHPTPPTVHDAARPASPTSSSLPAIPGYEVLELVGRGGMGRVYRAKHVALGRVVAIKVLANEPDERLLVRFRDEARAVARLQHPNIAQLYETGLADGRPFYAQEFVDGGSLAQAIAGQPQDPHAAAKLVQAIAQAIQFSHDNGILHRDLKPANILCGVESRNVESRIVAPERWVPGRYDLTTLRLDDVIPKVTDFGLAKTFGATPASDTAVDSGGGLTRTGEVLGTPAYMPPEQASGVVATVGPTADVYGLGAILYELLTGRPPFQSPEPLQTMLMVLSTDPVPPRTLQPKVPRDLETICLKCLEKQPRKRYASARELADDLRRFLNREPIVARPVGFFERTSKWAKRKPWQAVAVALAALGVIGLAVGFAILAEKNRQVRHANEQLESTNADLTRTNEELTRANNEGAATLKLALNNLEQYFFTFSQRLRDISGTDELRRDVITQARESVDQLDALRPGHWIIQEHQRTWYEQLGMVETDAENFAAAERDYIKSREITIALEARFPDYMPYRRDHLLLTAKIAALYTYRKDYKTSDELLESIVAPTQKLAADHPDDIRVLELRVSIERLLFARELRARKFTSAEVYLRNLRELRRKLAAVEPGNQKRMIDVIDIDTQMAIMLLDLKRLDEAAPVIAQAQAAVAKLPKPNTQDARKIRAYVQTTAGDYLDRKGESAKAIAELTEAAAAYEALAREFKNPMYLHDQADALGYLAWACVHNRQGAVGVQHLERAIEIMKRLTEQHPTNTAFQNLYKLLSGDLADLKAPAKPPEKKL